MKKMYKTTVDYRTEDGYFTETFTGTLFDNLVSTHYFLNAEDVLTANVYCKVI